ncbi:hypothetical protein PCASD_12032 [Puccinia coronata f. sp. avenae]|uniref:Exoribonuclease phosphorolytic domain-containing protein n=1 Tax=Puccinia coronata f. sp. avenae TaxID=200324 RepID=A0A2N5TBR5_9BASI|nr:hypothetical protein PCASD_12032 [Puccinia coronata f. sp. avenae]
MSILRSDSRTEADVRTLTMCMSVLSRSDGSGQFSFGDLKALSSVNGPAEVRIRDEKPTGVSLKFTLSRFVVSPSLAYSIKQFFAPLILVKKYPRSLIQINLQTLAKPSDRWTTSFSTESPEQTKVNLVDEIQSVTEKAALINAASLALMDSGICMRGCGFAVGVAIIPSSAAALNQTQDSSNQADHVVLDPNPAEESSAKSLHLIGVHFGHLFNTPSSSGDNIGRVTLCESNGTFDYEQLQTVLKYASLATQQIHAFVRRSCETVYQEQEENNNYSELTGQPSAALNTNTSSESRKKKKKNK